VGSFVGDHYVFRVYMSW